MQESRLIQELIPHLPRFMPRVYAMTSLQVLSSFDSRKLGLDSPLQLYIGLKYDVRMNPSFAFHLDLLSVLSLRTGSDHMVVSCL